MTTTTPVKRKASKRWHSEREKINRQTPYHPVEAFRLLKEMGSSKFDEAVEVHFKLGLDVRKADQMLRSTIALPHGTGKTVSVLVFAQGDKEQEAKDAGADWVGAADLEKKITEGWTDFDVCIATPDMMGIVGKLGRILGPRGKMPNPKTGTVTFDVAKAIAEIKGGKFEYRTDRNGIVHVVIGRKSFSAEQLAENYGSMYEEILRAKPSSAKGRYVESISAATTMSVGIPLDTAVTRNFTDSSESVS